MKHKYFYKIACFTYETKLSSAKGGSQRRDKGCCSTKCKVTRAACLSDSVQPQNSSSSAAFLPFFPSVNFVEFWNTSFDVIYLVFHVKCMCFRIFKHRAGLLMKMLNSLIHPTSYIGKDIYSHLQLILHLWSSLFVKRGTLSSSQYLSS